MSQPQKKNILVPVFAALTAVGTAVSLWLIFTYAPLDQNLFFNQKIFYWHVPHAFMMFVAVGLCGFASVAYLKTHKAKWDDIALASAEVAVAFGAAVLLTGSIWGKAAWDVWWTWEKRLTMSLLLWLMLVGYVLVRRFAGASAERLAALLAVFGTIGVPFIYFMVDRSDRHPQAGAGGVIAKSQAEIKIVMWIGVATFLCWFLTLLLARLQSVRAEREVRELRESAMDAGVLQ
jgi:heme exporter protein C